VSPVGAIVHFAGTGDPVDSDGVTRWLTCDGRAVSRTTYAALFSALASTYGAGNGTTTFNIPDLRSRVAVGAGPGPGLTNRALAANGGEETHVLSTAELPSESVNAANAQQIMTYYSAGGGPLIAQSAGTGVQMGPSSVTTGGTDAAHNNMQPYLAVNHIIRAL
jgi:microcystin-dependent protein